MNLTRGRGLSGAQYFSPQLHLFVLGLQPVSLLFYSSTDNCDGKNACHISNRELTDACKFFTGPQSND